MFQGDYYIILYCLGYFVLAISFAWNTGGSLFAFQRESSPGLTARRGRVLYHVMQSSLAQAVVERDLSIKQTRALVNIWVTQGKEAVGIMLGLKEI